MNPWIETLNEHAPNILRSLGLMEIQIALLALLVLAAESVLRQPLPKIRYALWLVVLAKCLLPPFLSIPETAQTKIDHFAAPILSAVNIEDLPMVTPATLNLSAPAIALTLWLAVSGAFLIIAVRHYWRLRAQLDHTQPMAVAEIFSSEYKKFAWPPIWCVDRLPTPAAIGLLRPQIYLTGAAAKSGRGALQAILYHELAHVRRRDGWVVLLQTLAQIIHPFNPFVWLMNLRLSRYREEICDDFALEHAAVPPRQYGEILLRFLETHAASPLTAQTGTCFFETANGFKQRLKYLLTPKEATMTRLTWKHKLLVAGTIVPLFAASWQCSQQFKAPTAPTEQIRAGAQPSDNPPPDFVQYDQAPRLTGRAAPKYPENAKAANLEGLVWAKIWIREDGKVQNVVAEKCSAWVCSNLGAIKSPALEKPTVPKQDFIDAAVAAAKQFEFEPAQMKEKPVATWVMIPFHFRLDDHSSTGSSLPVPRSAPQKINAAPASDFVMYDEAPRLIKHVVPAYPKIAQHAGIVATIWVKLQVDENGRVQDTQIQKSSGLNLGFEEAAMTAARSFEFAPAKLKNKPVATWISVPFHFGASASGANEEGC